MASYGVRDTNKTGSGRVVNPEDGKDALHRVPFIPGEVRDAVERVLTKFRGARSVKIRPRFEAHPALLSLPKAG